MITVMRRYRRVLQVGLLVVIAAFVLTSVYVGSMSGGARNRGDVVATVNGEAIPVERYQRRYQAYLDAYSRVYRDRFSPTLAEQLGLPQQAVNDLVQEAVVVQRARAGGLEVSDEALNAQVQAVPAFAENGRFSLARYQDFLRRRGMSASAFENDVRRELTRMKVETTVKAGIKVSDAELERSFALRREEVRAAWALMETAQLVAAATVSDEEVAEYLKAHPAEFQLPERRRVQYVTLAPKDFRPQLPDAEVEKYYTDHAKEFETPQQVHAAHVLVPVPQTGGSEAEDNARTKVAGFRAARRRDLRGPGQQVQGRRPRLDLQGRDGAGLRGRRLHAAPRRDLARARAQPVRLSRDQGVREPRRGEEAAEGGGRPDPRPARRRGRGQGRAREGRRGSAGAFGRDGLRGRGQAARADADRDDDVQDGAPPDARRNRSTGGGGVRAGHRRRLVAREDAGGLGGAEVDRGDPGRGAAAHRDPRQGGGRGEAAEGRGGRARARPQGGRGDRHEGSGGRRQDRGRADGRDGAFFADEAGGAAAGRRPARRAAVAGGDRGRAREVAPGLLRAEGARAHRAEHGRPRGRARPALARGPHAEAEPGVGGVGQPRARRREGGGPEIGRAHV